MESFLQDRIGGEKYNIAGSMASNWHLTPESLEAHLVAFSKDMMQHHSRDCNNRGLLQSDGLATTLLWQFTFSGVLRTPY